MNEDEACTCAAQMCQHKRIKIVFGNEHGFLLCC